MTPEFKQFDKICMVLAQQIRTHRHHQFHLAFLFQKLALINNKEPSKNTLFFEAKKNEIENTASLDLIAYTLLLTQTEGMLHWATQEFEKLAANNRNPANNDYISKVRLGLSTNMQRIAQDKKDYLALLKDSPFSCTQLEQAEIQSYPLDCYHSFKRQKMSTNQDSDSENDDHTELLCTDESLDLSL